MAIVMFIVAGGVKKGIERVSKLMMPVLALIMIGLAVWATTLIGAGEGYRFYLTPSFEELLSLETIAAASGQAFFSLSLGMGAMLTYASYLPAAPTCRGSRPSSRSPTSASPSSPDSSSSPSSSRSGLQAAVGESTSARSSSRCPAPSRPWVPPATSSAPVLRRALHRRCHVRRVAARGRHLVRHRRDIHQPPHGRHRHRRHHRRDRHRPAMSLDVLGAMDAIASDVFLPLGGLALALLVGWGPPSRRIEAFTEGSSAFVRSIIGGWVWTMRIVVPPFLLIVLSHTIPAALAAVRRHRRLTAAR
jgi:hypothetical protein